MPIPLTQTYLCRVIEPVHIGSKASEEPTFRESIARDQDGLPMLPASSLKGAIRAFWSQDFAMPGCDGKGRECPQPHVCASCAVFGYVNQHSFDHSASLFRFSDARLCIGVMRTKLSKVWLTTPDRLMRAGLIDDATQLTLLSRLEESRVLQTTGVTKDDVDYVRHAFGLESDVPQDRSEVSRLETHEWKNRQSLASVLTHLIVVDEPTIVRGSSRFLTASNHISIDSQTGVARKGALFSIEAIRPDSLFSFEVSFQDPISLGITELYSKGLNRELTILSPSIGTLNNLLLEAFAKAAHLGIGGKRSRGMGRVQIWPLCWSQDKPPSTYFGLPDAGNRPQVFISHAGTDKQFARRLAGDLRIAGCRVWLDEHEILVGDSIHRKIGEGIESADFVVLLISSAAEKSTWVRDEIEATLAKEKSCVPEKTILLPTLIESIEVPTMIRTRKWVQLYRNYHLGLSELLKSIHRFGKSPVSRF
jgi:CRISPR/Cas system CMR subunit Cmr4 (Cas7 group RAMP superfamily)